MAYNKKNSREPKYSLVIINSNKDMSKSFIDAAREFGDLMHIFPSNGSYNIDEICNLVWNYEKRHPEKSQNRTRVQIEEGINKLVQSNIVNSITS